MTVRVNKPEFNLREKLSELDYAQVPYEKMPAGSIIQHVTKSYHSSSGTTNTTMTASGKRIVIYPKYRNSQIIVKIFTVQYVTDSASGKYTIRRNGSDFVKVFNEDGVAEGGSAETTIGQMGFYGSGNTGWYGAGVAMVVDVDHNVQGESLEYELYYQAGSGGNIYWPPGSPDHTFVEAYEVKR